MDAILSRHEPSPWELFFRSPSLFLAQSIYTFFQRKLVANEQTSANLPRGRIRVVCVSDTHNQHDKLTAAAPLPEGDILIHAGDLTQSGTREELLRALEWLSAQPHPHKLFIAGNHDAALADPGVVAYVKDTFSTLTYLEDSSVTLLVSSHGGTSQIQEINVYGSPNTPRHGSWAFQYPRVPPSLAESSAQWAHVPLETEILVTHGPPAHHLDNAGAGCAVLLHSLWRVRPRLHVFGHLHAARGVEQASWGEDQRALEEIHEAGTGWWKLLVVTAVGVRRWWSAQRTPHTTLVNASVLGGFRDELTRGAIVVDI